MNTLRVERVFVLLLVLLAMYQLVVVLAAAAFTAGIVNDNEGVHSWLLVLVNAAGVVLIATGLRQRAQAPVRAGVFLAIGVVPSILMFWMIIPPIIALGVAIYAIQNGLSHSR